ncbi:hypothetical protein PENTCL1PPCAC_21422, partial [Pristionchus entomophagus]
GVSQATEEKKNMSPVYKFTYFHGRGIGEVARQLFFLSDTPFEDVRLVGEEWMKIKDQSPWGHLPWLEIDGKVLCQSFAIARYLAIQFGFVGKTPFESAMVDALGDQYKDYWNDMKPFFMPMYRQNMEGMKEEFEKKKKDVGEPARDKFYGILTKEYKKNGSNGHMVGDSLTWIDLVVVDHMGVMDHYVPGFLDGFEEMRDLQKKVNANPKLAEWIKKRPHTPQ